MAQFNIFKYIDLDISLAFFRRLFTSQETGPKPLNIFGPDSRPSLEDWFHNKTQQPY